MYLNKDKMTDIFDAKILCKKCNAEMKPGIVNRNGFELRAMECPNCGDRILHPADLNGLENFKDLKGKTFSVKLRMVGNSHAVSIPKEIIDFMERMHKQMRRQMDDMVSLCFEDFDRLSLRFGDEETDENGDEAYSGSIDSINNMRLKKLRRENEKGRRN